MRRVPKLFELNALSITLFYLIFATLWILLSDQFLIWITNNPELISRYQTFKGLFYVFVTGAFLYYLIKLSNTKIKVQKNRVDKSLEATKTATWYLDLDTEKLSYSSHFYKLFGFKENPEINALRKFLNTIDPQDREILLKKLENIVEGNEQSINLDIKVQWHDESKHWLRCQSTIIPKTDDHPATLAGVLMDVTNQKELEQKYDREKELFESIFQNIPVMIDVTTKDLKAIRVNKAFEEYTGYSESELQEQNMLGQIYPDPEVRKKAEDAIHKADGSWQEFESFTKSGEKRIQQWANISLSDGTTIGIGLDITEKKELARQHEEDRLELQKIYDNIPVFIDIHTKEGKLSRVNKFFEDVIGYSTEELSNISFEQTLFPNKTEAEKAKKHMHSTDGSWKDFRILTKQGDLLHTSWTNIQITEDLYIGIGLDTTELKQKERELNELNIRYKNAERMAKLGHWKRNLNTNESVVSTGFYEIAELDPNKDTISYDHLKTIIHPEDWDHFLKNIDVAINQGSNDFRYRLIGQNTGDLKHIHELGKVEFDKDGNPLTISGTIQDVTEEVEYQKKLEELTERYQRAEEIAELGHWVRNVQTNQAVWSQGFYNAIGLKPEDTDTSYESLLHMIHPEDREKFDSAFNKALETGSLNIRYRMIHPKTGETGYYQELAQTEYDEQGEPLFISGTIQNLTKREEFQIKLKKRNEFIETTLDNLPIGVAVNIIDSGEATLMNTKFSEIYGWPKEDLVNVDGFFEKIYPDDEYLKKIKDMILTDIASGDTDRMNWKGIEITQKNGEKRIVNAKNIPVHDQNLMISTVVDITAQAEAERKLAESERNYRVLFQESPQPMWIYNPENYEFIEVNNAAVEHYGYSRKEFMEMTILDIRPESDINEVKNHIFNRPPGSDNSKREWRHIKKNGDLIYVQIASSDIMYFENKYRLVLANDITRQRKAEEMVLSSLVEGENKERARIARELHDGIGQYLAAANMNFDAVKKDLNHLEKRRQEQFNKGLNLLKHAVTETTQISRNLLPRVVGDYGLVMAIESLIDSYSNNTEIDISYYHNVQHVDLSREIELNVYRIAQEAISNAIKYSEATQITVQLIEDELDLILSIDDNGVGFDLNSSEFEPGLGLQTIKTRTGALGGDLELDSKPGKGTFLHIIVPIQSEF
jgi:PAS domain S-box-containing protein